MQFGPGLACSAGVANKLLVLHVLQVHHESFSQQSTAQHEADNRNWHLYWRSLPLPGLLPNSASHSMSLRGEPSSCTRSTTRSFFQQFTVRSKQSESALLPLFLDWRSARLFPNPWLQNCGAGHWLSLRIDALNCMVQDYSLFSWSGQQS